jgi:hypothetical protein
MAIDQHLLSVSEFLMITGSLLSLILSISILAAFIHFYLKVRKLPGNRNLSLENIKNPDDNSESQGAGLIKKDMMNLVIFKKQALEEIDSIVMKVGCEKESINKILEKTLQHIEDPRIKDEIKNLFIKQYDRFIKILHDSRAIITDPKYSATKYYSFKKMKETHLPKNIMELLLTGSAHSIKEITQFLNETEDHVSACLNELIGLNITEKMEISGTEQYRITEKGISYYLEQYD